jgi:hypothetical protein
LAWHQALRQMSPPLATRSGVHRGSLVILENSPEDVALGAKPIQVEGVAKVAAARIMALARGGQTLLSSEARDALPKGRWRIQSHGHWRLKGLSEPLEIFEVGAEDAPLMPPPDAPKAYRVVREDSDWIPLQAVPNNLPSERDVFIGRREVFFDMSRRFEDAPGSYRCSASAGSVRRGSRFAMPAYGSASILAARGCATCRPREARMAYCMRSRRPWRCRWAHPTGGATGCRPRGPRAVPRNPRQTSSSDALCGADAGQLAQPSRPKPGSLSPAARHLGSRASKR